MMIFEAEEIFCSSEGNGQTVGIILADSRDLANKAAELVDLNDEGSENEKHFRATLKLVSCP